MKYHAYIGRWQSPHLGHKWLIDRNLAEGKPVLILIRDVPIDENNPFTAQEVEAMLRIAFKKEVKSGLVAIQIIPDIASVNYGRGVGYDVICHEEATPPEIKNISATEIRRQIRAGENGWRDMVIPGVEARLEEKFRKTATEIEIVEELGWGGYRTTNPFKILVNGKIYTTPEGCSSFWTEASALRYVFENFGVLPIDGVRQVPKGSCNG